MSGYMNSTIEMRLIRLEPIMKISRSNILATVIFLVRFKASAKRVLKTIRYFDERLFFLRQNRKAFALDMCSRSH